MKTPDDIKKGLLYCGNTGCGCGECPYESSCGPRGDGATPENDALAYIQQLETRLALAERERDAAIEKLKAYKCYEDESSFPKGMTQAEYFGITKDGVDD